MIWGYLIAIIFSLAHPIKYVYELHPDKKG